MKPSQIGTSGGSPKSGNAGGVSSVLVVVVEAVVLVELLVVKAWPLVDALSSAPPTRGPHATTSGSAVATMRCTSISFARGASTGKRGRAIIGRVADPSAHAAHDAAQYAVSGDGVSAGIPAAARGAARL